MSLTGPRFEKTAGVAQLSHDATERLQAIPGVEMAGSTCCLPLEGGFGLPFNVVGRPITKGSSTGGGGWMNVSPNYFGVFRIPMLRGRAFTERDDMAGAKVVIVNETMARQFWPKGDPLTDRILIGHGVGPDFEEAPRQIVGISGDVRDAALSASPQPMMYVPQAQVTDGMTALNARIGPLAWIVRTRGDPKTMASQIQEQLRQASGGLPVARVRSMDEVVIHSTARADFNMLLLTIFGGSALVLAAIGIYGLMSYSVEQRTQEIGIRMALGAESHNVRNLVVGQGMRLVVAGVVAGLAAAFGLTRLISSFLYGVHALDPLVFVTVPLLLSLVALFATWVPARRATRIDPIEALRYE
jgi:putative ABC transport system permease protein